MGEIVDFLKRSQLLADQYTQVLSDGLLAGKPFSSLLGDLRFSDAVVTQVALAVILPREPSSESFVPSILFAV